MYKFFPNESISRVHGKVRRTAGSEPLTIFPMYHPAAALHQPALRSALVADFAALALFLAAEPPAAKVAAAVEKPADQMTLFRD
jgi:DNA polymerase